MKKGIYALALCALVAATAVAITPTKDDKKPIVVDKMCYAEEIIEYDEEEQNIQLIEEGDDCENCVSICVRGKSELSLSPDRAVIYAVIENLDTDLTKSKDNNYTAFDNVVSALKASGVNDQQICLEYFNCAPSYDYSSGRTLQGYMTSTSFTVEVEEIENIKTYIDVMTENGVTCICNIKYQLSTMDEEYTNALALACENAKAKAVKLLGNDNLKLVKIKEEMIFSSNNLCRNYVEGVSSDLMGKINIEASVFAEFEAEQGAKAV